MSFGGEGFVREKVSTIRTVCKCRHSFSDQKCAHVCTVLDITVVSSALSS